MEQQSEVQGACKDTMISDALKYAVRATVPRPMRNWLRSPAKSADWLWAALRFRLGSVEHVAVAPGLSLLFHPRAYRVYLDAQVHDPEQREEFSNFVQHCRPGMRLFDVGAHFGVFSLVAAQIGGTAVAVDPSPTAVKMIETGARLNQLGDKIRAVQAAVSDADGKLHMLDAGVFSDGYYKLAGQGRPMQELTSTPAITVDDLYRDFGAPTHIKIDVEGHEAAVLRGASRTLAECKPLLFLELHNQMVRSDGGDPRAALAQLARLSYATYALSGEPIDDDSILQARIPRIVARATL